MAVSDKFKELVALYKQRKIAAPKLKAITIAQWIHESGRGSSDLCQVHNNFAGLKYRPELSHLCAPVKYSAHDGVDTYCSFKSLNDFISGYWAFISRSVYQGWGAFAENPTGYLDHLISCKYAEDPDYRRKVLGHLPEAEALLAEGDGVPYASATWLCRYQDSRGMPVIVAYAGSSPLVKFTSKVKEEQHSFENLFNNALTVTMASFGSIIPDVPEWFDSASAPPAKRLVGKKILVDPGHSKSKPGAFGRGGSPKPSEYAMNYLQATIIRDMLREEGAEVELFDPDPDSLTAVGKRAAGKDLFIAVHHNAANADGSDEGTETYIPKAASAACEDLANKVNSAIVAELGTRDRGVKKINYTVIATALGVGCPLCMLTESYFIDDYSSVEIVTDRSTRAAKAIAKAIIANLV